MRSSSANDDSVDSNADELPALESVDVDGVWLETIKAEPDSETEESVNASTDFGTG
jgi:hypothetical protein